MSLKSTTKTIRFCLNNVSWDPDDEAPVPGGMADRLIRPILDHLESRHELVRFPKPGGVNIYYSHRRHYKGTPGSIRSQEVGVFVSHGIADKAWRDTVGNSYEHVFVSGPGWSRKMLDHQCPIHRIVEVGYAKLDPLFTGPGGDPIRGERSDRIRVVWAPTHGGGGERNAFAANRPNRSNAWRSSWWDREEIIAMLPEDTFEIVEAPHPRHKLDRSATFDEYIGADAVIADGGSTIYEAMALDLPVVFPTWLLKNSPSRNGTFEHDIFRKRIGRHVDDSSKLAAAVEDAANRGITGAEQEFIEPILPRSYRGRSGRMHAEALDEIAHNVTASPYPPTVEMVVYRHRAGRTVTVPQGSKVERSYAKSGWWTAIGAG